MTGKDLKPDIVYRVTKDNSDESVFEGDLLFIDSQDGSLVCDAVGWLDKEVLAPEVMDFECELAEDWQVARTQWRTWMERRKEK